jgi:hypothetical protein
MLVYLKSCATRLQRFVAPVQVRRIAGLGWGAPRSGRDSFSNGVRYTACNKKLQPDYVVIVRRWLKVGVIHGPRCCFY